MSNETPKPNPKKTKSARKLLPFWFLLVLAVIIIYNLFTFSSFFFPHNPGERNLLLDGTHVYKLEVADTAAAQERGLSGRASMPANRGMLFDFGSEAERCMWMKDMKFPLDMVWADSRKKVTAVSLNISPSSYPLTYCKNAQYVVELNAGVLSVHGRAVISVGDTLHIR